MSTVPDREAARVPGALLRLLDDAAVFPPGNAPLAHAVAEHRSHHRSRYADLVGPFVVTDVALPDLLEELRARRDAEPLEVAVVVTGGAGAIEPAVRWASRASELRLAAVELALRDEEDLPRNARRVTTVVEQLRSGGDLDEEVPVYVEPPALQGRQPAPSWLGALDEVAALELGLKLRTGGTTGDAFPLASAVATFLDAALDRELPFKCTAGLHHAIRHRDPETGFEHHGFLNVLLATRAAFDGEGRDEAARQLEESDPEVVRARLAEAGADALTSTRRWFRSVGTCNIAEPLADLRDLGLLPHDIEVTR